MLGSIPRQRLLRWWMIRELVLTKGKVLLERGPGCDADPDLFLSTGFVVPITPIGKPVVDAVPQWPSGHRLNLPTTGPPPTESSYCTMATPLLTVLIRQSASHWRVRVSLFWMNHALSRPRCRPQTCFLVTPDFFRMPLVRCFSPLPCCSPGR